MNVGEMGNFISYAWAPASVVAPLGTVSSLSCPQWMLLTSLQFALMANCIFAPVMLGERFRKVKNVLNDEQLIHRAYSVISWAF